MKFNLDFCYINKELRIGGYNLYEHQKCGVRWLLNIERKCNGGLLADEMGLGKTIQMISMMIANPLSMNLIVCPASLINQWKTEILKFAPSIIINPDIDNIDMSKQNVFIISYNKLIRPNNFSSLTYNRLICDEAHYFRNSKSKTFKKLCRIKSKIRWSITGTPMQNYKKDLISMFKFIRKEGEISDLISKYMLRRTIDDLDFKLPKLTHNIKFIGTYNPKFMEMIENNVYMFHLEKILRLKQACIIPTQTLKSIKKKYSIKDSINRLKLAKLNSIVADVIAKNQISNKTIIFSYFRKEIQYLFKRLSPNIRVDYINGSISPKKKIEIINNLDLDVLIIQINAGGTGLNLQHYNNIIFTGPQWNPTLEQQAIARAYRIGQTKNVNVRRYIVGNLKEYSIEKKILKIQRSKLEMIKKYIV
jgi:SNF2 family DNA or RNA helicase